MKDEAGGRGASAPRSLADLAKLRTDYEDVEVPELGGESIRLYALSGTARARLVPTMAALAERQGHEEDPEVVAQLWQFQIQVVGAAMGYDEPLWASIGDVLGSGAIERLYRVASRLSGLNQEAQEGARERLRRRRSTASGTD